MKKYLALLLVLTLLLSGCGSKSVDSAYGAAMEAPMPEPAAAPVEEGVANGYYYEDAAADMEEAQPPEDMPASDEAGRNTALTEKLIYRADLVIETTDFDTAVVSLERLASSLGGFIESSNVSGNTSRQPDGTTRVVDRWANYVLRVPSARFEEAVNLAGGVGSVVDSGRSVENITSQFIDQEARKHSLEVQEERLLSMLERAEDVDTLILLESRLSEVRYEIESTERTLRNWQQQVDYSTVSVNLREVAAYTPTVPVQRSFSQRLTDAFRDGWSDFVDFLEDLTLGTAEALPMLVLLAILIAGVVLLVIFLRRRRARRRQNPPPRPPQQPPENTPGI